MDGRRISMDDRAVSITLTYVLTIAITTALVAGLVVASTDMLESQRDRGAENELTVVGERLASEITALDRANTTGGTTVETNHPSRVADTRYRVSLTPDHSLCDADTCVVLESEGADVAVAIPLADDVDVETGVTVRGGPIDVASVGTEITLREGTR